MTAPRPGWPDRSANRPGALATAPAGGRTRTTPLWLVVARVLGGSADQRRWPVEAAGEDAGAARLDHLGPEWKVLHAVPVGWRGGDVDHVVIGPGGVYTINCKHHADGNVWVNGDVFMVSGQTYPYVRNSRFEADRASKLLTSAVGFPVFARALIAVVGAHRNFSIKSQPTGGDVYVLGRKDVPIWLSRRSPVFDAEQVQRIYAEARKSNVWTA